MTAVDSDGILLIPHFVQCGSVSHVKVHRPLLLFLPFVWLPLLVELDVVVVATKNRSGTIVTAEKQNEDGY